MALRFNRKTIMLRTFGTLKLEGNLEQSASKPLLIFAYIVVNQGKHIRKKLESLFFDETTQSRANSLSNALVKLRKNQLIDFNDEEVWAKDTFSSDIDMFYRDIKDDILHRAAYETYQGKFLDNIAIKGLTAQAENWIYEKREELECAVFNAKIVLAKQELENLHATKAVQQAGDAWERHADAINGHNINPNIIEDLFIILSTGNSPLKNDLVRKIQTEFPDIEIDFDAFQDEIAEYKRKTTRAPINTDVPSTLTQLIGRESALKQVQDLIGYHRLVTLLGLGGIGKTRLAMHLANTAQQNQQYADGVHYYALETVKPEQFIFVLSQGLGLPPSYDTKQALRQYLSERETLFILDNFEHLVESHEVLMFLLQASPKLRLLITSRERINLDGEQLYDVPGLAYPEGNLDDITVAEAVTYAAVQLFTDRRSNVKRNFHITEGNVAHVSRICQIVWGMPLAIEIAAGMRHRTLEAIATGIGALDFLSSRNHGKPERHKTLRHVFDYSWQFLSEVEQQTFRQLAVFKGGFTIDAAQVIIKSFIDVEIDLLDKSLLSQTPEGRYEMHPLLYEYASEKLSLHPKEYQLVQDRHAKYYLEQLSYVTKAPTPEMQASAPKRLLTELPNVKAAWVWAIKNAWMEALQNACYPLQRLCDSASRYQEGITLFEQIESNYQVDTQNIEKMHLLGTCLANHAWLLMRVNQYERAISFAEEALTHLADHGVFQPTRTALNTLGSSLLSLGKLDGAYEAYATITEKVVEKNLDYAGALGNMGYCSQFQGEFAKAETHLIEGLEIAKNRSNIKMVTWFEYLLGRCYCATGSLQKAENTLFEALAKAKLNNSTHHILGILLVQAKISLLQEEIDKALNICYQAIEKAQLANKKLAECEAFTLMGDIALTRNDFGTANEHLKGALEQVQSLRNVPLTLRILAIFLEVLTKNNSDLPKTHMLARTLQGHSTKIQMSNVDRKRLKNFLCHHGLDKTSDSEPTKPLSVNACIHMLLYERWQDA